MKMHLRHLIFVTWIGLFVGSAAFAQQPQTRPANESTETREQPAANLPALDTVAYEIGLLRKSVQTLNTRLQELSQKGFAGESGSNSNNSAAEIRSRILTNLELLTRAEQRADLLRKQFVDVLEKETALKNRLVQIEEDMRPENIERSLNLVGSTRTMELREARRRSLENERRGIDALLNQITPSRIKLDEDARQADTMVARLRERVLPLIDKEIDKIKPPE